MENNTVNDIDKARNLNRMACEYIDEDDLDSAEEKLTEAIRLAPKLAERYTNLGVLRCWEGDFEEVIVLQNVSLINQIIVFRAVRKPLLPCL